MDITKIFEDNGLRVARMVGGSKTGYCKMYPKNKVIFNANIITNLGKVWYGDIDLTISEDVLKKISVEIGSPIYVLYEQDARFGTEERDVADLIKDAMFIVDKDGLKFGIKGKSLEIWNKR
jgi:hypothetical protein